MNKNKLKTSPEFELFKKLRDSLNPKLASADFSSERGIIITTSNGHSIFISLIANKVASTHGKKLTVYFDPHFEMISKIVNKKSIVKDFNYEIKSLKSIIEILQLKKGDSLNKVKELYWNIHQRSIKKLISKKFKLGLNPDNEFFFFGNDELQGRYSRKRVEPKKFKTQKIKITDKSALLFESEENGRSIDMDIGMSYNDGRFIYPEVSWAYKKIKEQECDQNCDARYSSKDHKVTYYKKFLPKGTDLSNKKKIPFKSVNGMKLTVKVKDGKFLFYDKQGQIEISHPDILVYFLKGLKS